MTQKTILTVDVETVPNEEMTDLFLKHNPPPGTMKKPETIEAWRIKEMSLSPMYCRIVGLNWMAATPIRNSPGYHKPESWWVEEEVDRAWWTRKGGSETIALDEVMLLWKFWRICTGEHLPSEVKHLVGYNILGFDIPVILNRSIKLGLKPSRFFGDLKPWEDKVIDLMKRMFSSQKWKGMKEVRDSLRDLLNIPEEYAEIENMEGGSVYELFMSRTSSDLDTLKMYGKLDVISNTEIWRVGNGYWW
jgi:hypothetical protein